MLASPFWENILIQNIISTSLFSIPAGRKASSKLSKNFENLNFWAEYGEKECFSYDNKRAMYFFQTETAIYVDFMHRNIYPVLYVGHKSMKSNFAAQNCL